MRTAASDDDCDVHVCCEYDDEAGCCCCCWMSGLVVGEEKQNCSVPIEFFSS